MKRLIKISFVSAVIFLNGFSFAGTYGGGTGTEEDPYQIWTAEQMNTIGLYGEDWDKHFILMADIDLSQYTGEQYNPIGTNYKRDNWELYPAFSGSFDGNGHVISGLTIQINTPDLSAGRAGLFGYVARTSFESLKIPPITPNPITSTRPAPNAVAFRDAVFFDIVRTSVF